MFSRLKQKIAVTFLTSKPDDQTQSSTSGRSLKNSRKAKSVESLYQSCELDESTSMASSIQLNSKNSGKSEKDSSTRNGNKMTSNRSHRGQPDDRGGERKLYTKNGSGNERRKDLESELERIREDVNNFRADMKTTGSKKAPNRTQHGHEQTEREGNSASHGLKQTKQLSSYQSNTDSSSFTNRKGMGTNRNSREQSGDINNQQKMTSSNKQHAQIKDGVIDGHRVKTAANDLNSSNRTRKDNSYLKSRQAIIIDSKSAFERQSSVKSGSRMVGAQNPLSPAAGDHSLGYFDYGGGEGKELDQKYLMCKLKQYIFVYNECANRHWLWNQLPSIEKSESFEPEWDESWQPNQPICVTLIRNAIHQHSCNKRNKQQQQQPAQPKRRLHTISRLFNFYENTLEDEDDENEDAFEEVLELDPRSQSKVKKESKEESHHTMARIDGVPWKQNVMDGNLNHRRNICMFQVELLVTNTDTFPSSDEDMMRKREEKMRLSRRSRRRSSFITSASCEVQQEEADPIVDAMDLKLGNVARLRAEFKKNSEEIAHSINNSRNNVGMNKRSPDKVPVEHVEKVSVVFKGNGKFGTMLKAGQTGAANEDMLGMQGGPVEIVAMREFYVEISLLYIFSLDTLQESDIIVKSEGQKDVEELGRSAFSSNKVSQLVAKYAERGDDWMRSHSDYTNRGTASSLTNQNTPQHTNTSTSLNEIEERQQKMEANRKRRQEEERQKCVWTSRMRHFHQSINELLAAKFLPDVIVAVLPEDGERDLLEKYVRLELKSCANKFSGLPANWPKPENILIVPFSYMETKSHDKLRNGINKLIFSS